MKRITKKQPYNIHIIIQFSCRICGKNSLQNVDPDDIQGYDVPYFGNIKHVVLQCPNCKREWKVEL